MTDDIEIISRDHVNLDQVLNVLETAVDGLAPDQSKPDLEPLYLAIFYIRVFPDRCHHPKEERYCSGRFGCDARKPPNSSSDLKSSMPNVHG